MLNAHTEQILRQHFPFLSHLAQEDLGQLLMNSQLLQLPPDTRVFDEHSPCSSFPLVLEGSIRVSKVAPSGREIVLYHVTPGDSCIVTSSCLLGQCDYNATGETETEVTLVTLPRSTFENLMASDREFRRFVFHEFGARLSGLVMLVESVAFQRLDQRLAAWIMDNAPVIRATHQQIADELGSVREMVSRLLGQFSDRGWVRLGRERVRITDPAALQQVAEGKLV
jgi:CRP/FNR family transcriptional regulator, anaerobic regulatory protein